MSFLKGLHPLKQFLRKELRAGMREWQESVLDSLMGMDYR